VTLHCQQELRDAGVVDPVTIEKDAQRGAEQPGVLKDRRALRGSGEPVKTADEIAHRADLSATLEITSHTGCDQPLEGLPRVPVRGDRIGGSPLPPCRICWLRRDQLLAIHCERDREVRVQRRVIPPER